MLHLYNYSHGHVIVLPIPSMHVAMSLTIFNVSWYMYRHTPKSWMNCMAQVQRTSRAVGVYVETHLLEGAQNSKVPKLMISTTSPYNYFYHTDLTIIIIL